VIHLTCEVVGYVRIPTLEYRHFYTRCERFFSHSSCHGEANEICPFLFLKYTVGMLRPEPSCNGALERLKSVSCLACAFPGDYFSKKAAAALTPRYSPQPIAMLDEWRGTPLQFYVVVGVWGFEPRILPIRPRL
jgi:hypothetical protein